MLLCRFHSLRHLLGIGIGRSSIPVSLTVDRRISTTSDSVHFPPGIDIVNDVYIPSPAPGHSLNQLFSEVVEGDGHLHAGIRQVIVAVSEQHYLVVMGEEVVGYGDSGGPHDGVYQAVFAM